MMCYYLNVHFQGQRVNIQGQVTTMGQRERERGKRTVNGRE